MTRGGPLFDVLPPRWRGIRRVAIAYGLLLVAVVVLRTLGGICNTRAFDALTLRANSLGLPSTVEDIFPHPLPPGRPNAAAFYRQAFAINPAPAVADESLSSHGEFNPDPRHNRTWLRLARDLADRSESRFAIARQAINIADVDWRGPQPACTTPLLYTMLPYLNPARQLGEDLADAGLSRHFDGDDRAAVDDWRSALELSRAVDAEHFPVAHLAALNVITTVLDRIDQAAPDLAAATANDVARIRSLMRTLGDAESRVVHSGAASYVGDALMLRDSLDYVRGDAWLTRGVFDSAAAVQFRSRLDAVDLRSPEPPRPEAPPVRFRLFGRGVSLGPFVYPHETLRAIGGSLTRMREADRRAINELRLTRVQLAVRTYHAAAGRWPADVDALVPAYLDAVPRSAHRPAERRVEFVVRPHGRPDGSDRPLVFVDADADANEPLDWPTTAWTTGQPNGRRGIETGRQWRDAGLWPLSAYRASSQGSADRFNDAVESPSTLPAGQ